MKIENYERLRQRYEARPPFNFYLNPDLEVITKVGYNYVETGFYDKTSENHDLIGACMIVGYHGSMYQGYCQEDKSHFYGRKFFSNGEFYEGCWDQDNCHGKGIKESEDGSIEIGHWEDNMRQGVFEYIDENGNIMEKTYEDDEEVYQRS